MYQYLKTKRPNQMRHCVGKMGVDTGEGEGQSINKCSVMLMCAISVEPKTLTCSKVGF